MKTKIILSLVFLLAFASCKKDNDSVPVVETEYMSVSLGGAFTTPGESVVMDIQGDMFKIHLDSYIGGRFPKQLSFTFKMDSVRGIGSYSLSEGHYKYPNDYVDAIYNPLAYYGTTGTNLGMINKLRTKPDTVCIESTMPLNEHKLTITKWGNASEIIEGTISGSLFDDGYSEYVNCLNSIEYQYSGSFRLKRKW